MYTQDFSCWPYASKTSQNIYLDLLELDENLYVASRQIDLLYTQTVFKLD